MKNPLRLLSFKHVFMCLVLCFFSSTSFAAQLLMIEEEGCVYCAKFNAEIAPIYPKTNEGKIAPLRRHDLANAWPEDLSTIEPSSVTPTFVLIEDGREIGRLYGYRGDEFFWFLLEDLLAKLEPQSSQSKP